MNKTKRYLLPTIAIITAILTLMYNLNTSNEEEIKNTQKQDNTQIEYKEPEIVTPNCESYTNVESSNLQDGYLILVNKHYYLDKNYTPNNLAYLKECSDGEQLSNDAAISFTNMCKQAQQEGLTLLAISGYRSYNRQSELYNNYLTKYTQNIVDTFSARPGHSEHQTGFSTDVSNGTSYTKFEQTNEYLWMKENAYKYGFIERYQEGKELITGYNKEPWHWRYVGIDEATYIKEKDITYEQYYATFINNK